MGHGATHTAFCFSQRALEGCAPTYVVPPNSNARILILVKLREHFVRRSGLASAVCATIALLRLRSKGFCDTMPMHQRQRWLALSATQHGHVNEEDATCLLLRVLDCNLLLRVLDCNVAIVLAPLGVDPELKRVDKLRDVRVLHGAPHGSRVPRASWPIRPAS